MINGDGTRWGANAVRIPIFFCHELVAASQGPSLLLQPPVLGLRPQHLLQCAHVPLLHHAGQHVGYTGYGQGPVYVHTINVEPGRQDPTIEARLPHSTKQQLGALRHLSTAQGQGHQPQNTNVDHGHNTIDLSTLTAVTVQGNFRQHQGLVFSYTTRATSLVGFVRNRQLLSEDEKRTEPTVLQQSQTRAGKHRRNTHFLCSLAYTHGHQPVASVGSRPSHGRVADGLRGARVKLRPIVTPGHNRASTLVDAPLLAQTSDVIRGSSGSYTSSKTACVGLPG